MVIAMRISQHVVVFILYSLMGWVYETVLCTARDGKWRNRGFLYGPVCPIYGFGAIAILLIERMAKASGVGLASWQIFAISAAGSAVLEYATSWMLERLFHALWWDYSWLPFNVRGRISLFTSLGFGLAGLLIVRVISPGVEKALGCVSAAGMEVLALACVFLLAVDITLTVTALIHFDETVKRLEKSFNSGMEAAVSSAVQGVAHIKEVIKAKKPLAGGQKGFMGALARAAVRRAKHFRGERCDKRKNIR